jgi:hypothetical protein
MVTKQKPRVNEKIKSKKKKKAYCEEESSKHKVNKWKGKKIYKNIENNEVAVE